MSQRRHNLVWEVLARVGASPARAVLHLAEYEQVVVTEAEAARHLAAAKKRNNLKLITARPDNLGSNWYPALLRSRR